MAVTADELFERWQEMLEQGRFLSAEILCKEHPDLLPELQRRIQQYAVEVLGSSYSTPSDSTDEPPRDDDSIDPAAKTALPGAVTVIETVGIGPVRIVEPPDGPPPADTSPVTSAPAGVPSETRSSDVITGDEFNETAPTDDVRVHAVSSFQGFRLLARGGLGEVYVADDLEFHRDVVLKFMRREFEEDAATGSQFELEAEITARLEHPGVVPMYGIGRSSEGRIFQVMRYIRGESFEARIARYHRDDAGDPGERNIEFRALLTRFASVCQTIAYAHTRGIVHRDIKPDNVMLGRYGETLVVDWGLAMPVARRKEDRASGEQTIKPSSNGSDSSDGMIAGTPCYMSPEQANGDADIGPASDIYSLGAVLYKLLTGRLAYPGSRVSDVLRHVRSGVFEAPRSRERSIPPPLEAICLKAMQQEPDDRYATALELAADVEAYLAGESVSAHREGWMARTGRWLRRNERVARVLATVLLLGVVGSSVWATATVLYRRHALEQRVESLVGRALLHEALLHNEMGVLRNDVRLLANRPVFVELLKASRGNGVDPIAGVPAGELFEEFLDLNPDYMQVRLLDEEGKEVVRIDRESRGSDPQWAETLQDKSDRPYFTETRELPPGRVYVSPIDVNKENGRRQWDIPVVRVATPLHDADEEFVGIVVINMHFAHLAEGIAGEGNRAEIAIVNEAGGFLVHPVEDLAFAFERGLELPVDTLYPFLGNFLRTGQLETSRFDVVPRPAVLLVATSSEPEVSERVSTFAEVIVSDEDFDGVELRRTRYEKDDTGFEGNDARTVVALLDVTSRQRELLIDRARSLGNDVRIHVLPSRPGDHHAVYARKIGTGETGQRLVLVMTVPH